jgi:thioredoxin-related protein
VNGLESEYGDRIAFQKLNVDEPDGKLAAQAYRARGHPTAIILDANGKQIWSRTGALARSDYAEAIESALSP